MTQPKETRGQTWWKASTQFEGELHRRMEPVLVLLKKKKKSYPCLIMPAKISWFFQPIPVFVGNLAQNSTRFSLSNEPFLLIKSCVFFLCVHANNILSTPLYLQNHRTKNHLVFFFPFSQNNKHDPMFSQGFLGNQSLVQKQKSYWCLSETNRFWKFRWFLREVSIHLETQKKKHNEVTPKAEFYLHE